MENNENSSVSSNYTEEDELFDYIANQDENKVNNFLKRKKYQIYDFRHKDGKNSTLLHTSVYKKNFNIVKSLIDYCKLNFPDKLVQFVNAENTKGICPIHYASFGGNIDIIKLLVESGADITKKTEKKLNIFHYCAQGNMPNSLMFFYLKFQENKTEKKKIKYKLIFEKDGAGSTVLHWAVYSVAEDFLLYLINLDIFEDEQDKLNFINTQDNNGFTALHLCVTSKSSRIALKLLQNGASTNLRDFNKRTALDFAVSKDQDEIKEYLADSKKCQLCRLKAPLRKIKKSNKNIVAIFIFQIFSVIILFFSTFPIIFYQYKGNGYIKSIYYIFISLFILFFVFYTLLLMIDPGVKRKRTLEDLKNSLRKNVDLTKCCYKCFILKTKTSKHCIVCDCCYEKFDHHCFWINKCVAKNNFVLFIIFLFLTSIYLSVGFIIVILGLINIGLLNEDDFDVENFCKVHLWLRYFKSNEICETLYDDEFVIHLVFNIILTLINIIFLIPECFLLFLHINVIMKKCKKNKIDKKDKFRISESTLINDNDNSFHIFRNN